MIKKLLSIRLKALHFGTVVGKEKKGKAKSISPAAIAGFTVLYALLLLVLFGVVFMFAFSLSIILVPAGAGDFYYGIFALAAVTVIFLLSIFETKSELFECKDNELLLSMPIKPRDIVAARILIVLIYNYLEEILIMLPCIIVYIIYSPSVNGIVGSILMIVFLPLISKLHEFPYLVLIINRYIFLRSFIFINVFQIHNSRYFPAFHEPRTAVISSAVQYRP